MRRPFLSTIYRPSARNAQLLDVQRRVQRTERSPARLSLSTKGEVEKRVRKAIPLHVQQGSKVEIQVRVR